MKIINSPVRNIAPDSATSNDPRVRGWASKPKAIAQAKKIARKRERAMLRQLAARELLQEQLFAIAEDREAERLEREYAYFNLMQKLTKPTGQRTSHAKLPSFSECGEFHVGERRLEIRIECMVSGAQRTSDLLASCATYD